VQYRQDSVVINKDGKPVAALVDARLFERIRCMQARFDALCHRIEVGSGKNIRFNRQTLVETTVFAGKSDCKAHKTDAGYFLPLGKIFPWRRTGAYGSHESGNATAMPPHRFGIPTASNPIENR
jgi:hypothetical protein